MKKPRNLKNVRPEDNLETPFVFAGDKFNNLSKGITEEYCLVEKKQQRIFLCLSTIF